MELSEAHLIEMTLSIGSTFGVELEAYIAVEPEMGDGVLTGWVTIGGAFEGAVLLRCERPLAGRIAAAMLELDEKDVSDDDVLDAFGELANVVGGNLKALLPGPSTLSIPSVEPGADEPPGFLRMREVRGAAFRSQGGRLDVSLWEAEGRS